MADPRPVVIGITGASGAALARRCVELLLEGGEHPLVLATAAAHEVWRQEVGGTFEEWIGPSGAEQFDINDVAAPIASGTFETKGMIVMPCSMASAAAIAHGLSANLLQRAADVTIKEGRPLVLVPRESPLSVIHLTNLLTLAQAGAKILLPVPAFYTGPKSVADIVEAIVRRALGALGLPGYLTSDQRYYGS